MLKTNLMIRETVRNYANRLFDTTKGYIASTSHVHVAYAIDKKVFLGSDGEWCDQNG